MKRIRYSLSALIFIMALNCFGQTGILRGEVYEEGNPNEKIISATVKATTASAGAYTDLEGAFSFQLPIGTHSIEITYLQITKIITEIVIKENEVTYLEIPLSTSVKGPEIVIVATRLANTTKALDVNRKNTVSFTDGLSGQQASRSGASDAGQMSQQIPGLSVQGGKYVFVRGLGDRYTKTILNGMVIPGLDPDRNTVQMDVFPSNILDNIIVFKTFTPDLPGDWAGGVVDISTKAFPITKTQTLGFGMTYNPSMHFQAGYITHKGGNLDWLAFDDGTRRLPLNKDLDLTADYDPALDKPELTSLTRSFNKQLAPNMQTNIPDFKFNYSLGDQINRGDTSYGYTLSLNYSRQTEYYDSVYFGSYIKSQSLSTNELLRNQDAFGPLGSVNTMWSALGGVAYKRGGNRYTLSALHIQNGESRSANLQQENYRENIALIFKSNLEYTQRSVSNMLLSGKHVVDSSGWTVEWKLSPTFSRIYEPDIKLTAFEYTDDSLPIFIFSPSTGAVATRTYRYLNEWNYNARIDFEKSFELWSSESKIKFGALETYKIRDFQILNYQFRVREQEKYHWSGNADELLYDENIWTPNPGGSDSGVYVTGNFEPANTFTSEQNVLGLYAMHELPVTPKLLFIYGLRMEKVANLYTGTNQRQTITYDRDKLLDELNLLPALNLKYEIRRNSTSEVTNFRFSYSRTVVRPSFKELSNAQIVDRISGRTFLGNDSLDQTLIDNIDLRWELFGKYSQMISVSAFYKRFQKPIELVAYNATSPNDFQPQNVGNATIYGLEIELRKKLKFASDTLYITSMGLNATYVYSSVEMTSGERAGRQQAAREGEVIGTHRDMVGQSPYIVNAYINYSFFDSSRLDLTITYNVQGPRLAVVGVSRNPDVYEMPFHSLIFRGSIDFGKSSQYQLSFTAKNILNSTKYMVYKSYEAQDQMFSYMMPRQQFSLGFRYILD